MREYGKALAGVLLALALIALTFIVLKLQQDTPWEKENYVVYKDSQMMQAVHSRAEPDIMLRSQMEVTVGTDIPLENLFTAKDADGKELEVQIIAVRTDKDEEAVYPFTEPGVYQIEVRTKDSWYVESRKLFRIPVNREAI